MDSHTQVFKRQKVVKINQNLTNMNNITLVLKEDLPEETICSYHFYARFNPLDHGWIVSQECHEFIEEYLDTKDFQQALNGKFVKKSENGIVSEKILIRSKGIVYRKRQVPSYNGESVVPFKILGQRREFQKDQSKLMEIVAEYENGDRHHFYQIKSNNVDKFEALKNSFEGFSPKPCRSPIMEGVN